MCYGMKRSGKGEVSKVLEKYFPQFKIKAFAKKVKEIVADLYGMSLSTVEEL
jgi:hypothetical protein